MKCMSFSSDVSGKKIYAQKQRRAAGLQRPLLGLPESLRQRRHRRGFTLSRSEISEE
jgi:hypothetical protein